MSAAIRPDVVVLLVELDPETLAAPPYRRDDGTLLTTEEAALVATATWNELLAGREYLAAALEMAQHLAQGDDR